VLKSPMELSLLRPMLSWHTDLTIADTHDRRDGFYTFD
jgi:hypothetical protein